MTPSRVKELLVKGIDQILYMPWPARITPEQRAVLISARSEIIGDDNLCERISNNVVYVSVKGDKEMECAIKKGDRVKLKSDIDVCVVMDVESVDCCNDAHCVWVDEIGEVVRDKFACVNLTKCSDEDCCHKS